MGNNSNSAKWIEQAGKYDLPDDKVGEVDASLSDEGKEELYVGIEKYQNKHDKVSKDPMFYRKQFIGLCDGALAFEDSNEKDFPVRMTKLFGGKGAELYKKALEEERFSHEYMDAVMVNSVSIGQTTIPGRAVTFIGGPSGAGKTTSANAVNEAREEERKALDAPKNPQVTAMIDGGGYREASQMRKLALQTALSLGYTGIKDLHKRSKVLEGVKKCHKEALFNSPKVNHIVINETFSQWSISSKNYKKLINDSDEISNGQVYFVQVKQAHDADGNEFSLAVKKSGNDRAFKNVELPKDKISLNYNPGVESKAYNAGPGGLFFNQGVSGSDKAEQYYRERMRLRGNPENCITVEYGRILLKESQKGQGDWQPARSIDNKHKDLYKLFPKKAYQAWLKREYLERDETLEKYAEKPEFSRDKLIKNSIQSTNIYNLQRKNYKLQIYKLENQAHKLQTHLNKNAELVGKSKISEENILRINRKYRKGMEVLDKLPEIYELSRKPEKIEIYQEKLLALKNEIDTKLTEMTRDKDFGYFSKTKSALKSMSKNLQQEANRVNENILEKNASKPYEELHNNLLELYKKQLNETPSKQGSNNIDQISQLEDAFRNFLNSRQLNSATFERKVEALQNNLPPSEKTKEFGQLLSTLSRKFKKGLNTNVQHSKSANAEKTQSFKEKLHKITDDQKSSHDKNTSNSPSYNNSPKN